MHLAIYTDGGARGNPGPAGFGLVVYDPNNIVIFQHSQFLGPKTNNEAEYAGLIFALRWLADSTLAIESVDFYSDSELMIRQLNGLYKVKAANLQPLFAQAKTLISQFNFPISFLHTPREGNVLADELANQAMDRQS